ncbi:cation:proton antiporter [Halalkalicoccus sp. NIPERK01]|uniref:cation:proton antiporter domain-containing protein n=1 Tax=Halalkalicoccus sp. NIPERK01 TaxID=3053469 RepID=UPI00256EDBCD|nr:cation:proton antiporter [Halalkalicoccus sp. NIPERK01]MDL5362324.1 cation:proton antiporter [Halalkalicoccus sp. NIPERK01]
MSDAIPPQLLPVGVDPNLLLIVASIVAFGVLSQVLADRYRVPSVLFLILSGIVLGPKVLGIVTQSAFGGSLSTIVGLSVAIIVFEGAFHLHVDKLRQSPVAAVRLITVGSLISFLGTAAAVYYLLGADIGIALVVGALLIATGPTVITPILEIVPVRRPVGAALETEGIVNDVTAAILAAVIFKAVTAQQIDPRNFLVGFVERLGVGVGVGLLVAGLLWYVLTRVDLSSGNAPENARLITFAGALVAYSVANTIATEAGVAAVATAGVVLGNVDIPYREEIEEFKGTIRLIVLSFIFIALAALIEIDTLLSMGLAGVAVVAIVALVLRPLLVFLSTVRTGLSFREKLFVSAVGPRGIIPAAIATLFALELQHLATQEGRGALVAQSNILAGTVFMVIVVTVVLQGGPARWFAERLDILPMRVLIVGSGKVGRSLAERLVERGEDVVVIEEDEETLQSSRSAGFTVKQGDGTDTDVLRSAGIENAKAVIAATGDDDTNLLVSQLARSTFDVEDVIARVNDPKNVDPLEELGVQTISSTDATAWAIDNAIERPALSDWMTEIGRSGDVQEIEVTSEDLAGKSIATLAEDLPNRCLIALVGRDGESRVPDADDTLQYGDHVTFLGQTEAVREAIDRFHPHD